MSATGSGLVSTVMLSRLTGYSISEIILMAADGQIEPARVRSDESMLWDPKVLSPKPIRGNPIQICEICDHYEQRWCKLKSRSVAYNHKACEHIKIHSTEVKEVTDEMAKPKAEITEEQRQKALDAYRKTRVLSEAMRASGLSEWLVRRVIKESMHQTEPIDQVDTVDVKVESVDEKPDQESVEPELVATVDARAILQRDLEEAQKALVVLDTIRQVYGEASELEDAVVQAYRRRRQVA